MSQDENSSIKLSLLDQIRHNIRLKHYSIRTEEAYVHAIKRFILFHNKRYPKEMGADEVRQFVSHLANTNNVAASTQNQILSALLFLYREVLARDITFLLIALPIIQFPIYGLVLNFASEKDWLRRLGVGLAIAHIVLATLNLLIPSERF